MPTRAGRIEGGIVGLLVGDALGVPYEFQDAQPLDRIDFKPPPDHRAARPTIPPGTWSDDGAHIAVGGAAPEVTLYDAESGKRTASCKGHRAGIYAVAFSPDGQTLATGGFDGEVRLYRVGTGELVKEFVPVPIS